MQLPADQRAFAAARATVDPEQRLTAMRDFVKTYPKSSRADRAQSDIFDTLVKYFPQRTAEIDAQARLLVKHSGKGFSKLSYEYDVADSLANAGDKGVDLPLAEKFAKDATDKLTETTYDKAAASDAKKYKYPVPSAASTHASFARGRANALAAFAKVDLDENKIDQAHALLDEAYNLDPTVSEVNLLEGELALNEHKDSEALEDFERAQLSGELKSPQQKEMMELYRQAHDNSDAGFTAEMDGRYRQLFPTPFTPQKHESSDGSRTTLLELFTGSACEPCVSADLAVDALLDSYPRKDLVALSFDQHIPEPDPLANPESVARGTLYGIPGTPTYVLNGKKLSSGGGSRLDAKKYYDSLSKSIEIEAAIPSGVELHLIAERDAEGVVHAQASVDITNPEQMQKSLVSQPEAAAANSKTPIKTPPAAAPVEPHLVVNFALVEDDIRYSGENGIRFHRMVVRSLALPADSGLPVEPGKPLHAIFNPAKISSNLTEYLNGYEQKNDRFGKVEFLSKDTTIHPSHMAVAAWVQDTTTHRVLQAAFIPISQEQSAGQGQ
jgi:predicted negative regulator of RcsB-dependent stress response